MASDKYLEILRQGVQTWNEWRKEKTLTTLDLTGINFAHQSLHGINLSNAHLQQASFYSADLSEADLSNSNLHSVQFTGTNLTGANLQRSELGHAYLNNSNLTNASFQNAYMHSVILGGGILDGANFHSADLNVAHFKNVSLNNTQLTNVMLLDTTFTKVDLSGAKGLETVVHRGPSSVDIPTLYLSKGQIPEIFLRGCGVPDNMITHLPSLIGKTIEFYSCFISYSHHDEAFADRLCSRLRDENLRVWYAPEDIQGGKKTHEQIYQAIEGHDRLLLVLSDHSLQSEWVMTEIRRARKVETTEQRRKLFPIRLTGFESLKDWECFDADTGKDLAVEVREYFIPDFSDWKNHDAFEEGVQRLLRDLRAAEMKA